MSDPEPSTDACRSPFADDTTERGACAFLRRIGGHYPTREVSLFGSRTRGTHQASSDADLAERSRISGEMAEIAFNILRETGLLVQAVPLWESEWRHPERFPNPTLIANIRRDGVRL
ncbi:nucleotidyltransferase domain-containing protein [Methylorubrum extorquens]